MTYRRSALTILAGIFLAVAAQAGEIRVEASSAALPLAKGFTGGGAARVGMTTSAKALRHLCEGAADVALVSRPVLAPELKACAEAGQQFVEVPLAFDALAVVVNPRNPYARSLSLDELKSAWRETGGKAMSWRQVNGQFPDVPLKVYAPAAALEEAGFFVRTVLGPNAKARGDLTTSADDDVIARAVARDIHGIGVIPLTYYEEQRSRVRAVGIARKAGARAVLPSGEAVANGSYGELAYPLIAYIRVQALARPEVREYAVRLTADGARVASSAGYVALSDAAYASGEKRLQGATSGSRWSGELPAGMTFEAFNRVVSGS